MLNSLKGLGALIYCVGFVAVLSEVVYLGVFTNLETPKWYWFYLVAWLGYKWLK